jgi:hypothetical protein
MRAIINYLLIAITMIVLARISYPQMIGPYSVKAGKSNSTLPAGGNRIDTKIAGTDRVLFEYNLFK